MGRKKPGGGGRAGGERARSLVGSWQCRVGPYSSAHGTLVTVVPSPEEAVPAEGVPTWGGHRLIQHLQTQDALKLVYSVCSPCPAPHSTLQFGLNAFVTNEGLHSPRPKDSPRV